MQSTEILQNSSNRQKDSRDLIDRISALPDSIISLILSSLPTKNAVATSILSKRWKFSWITVLNLDFCQMDNPHEEGEDEHMKFVQFVSSVLLHHDAGLLHKFRLVWTYRSIPSQLNSWISTAITRNVRQLVLSLGKYSPVHPVEIPTSIFNCHTLQSLVLKGVMWVPASIVVCLPRLESLKLDSIYFKSEEALHKIIRECPMLNYLCLLMPLDIHQHWFSEYDDDRSEFRYIISSTSLRRLELDAFFWNMSFPFSLELEASSLEYLKIDGFVSKIFVQGSLSSLVEADFRIIWWDESEYTEDTYNSVVEVVRAFDCAKSITLSTDVMWALSHATKCLSTKFTRLTKLEAEVDCLNCSSMGYFIQSSDNLEVLTIYQDSMDQYISGSDLLENDHDHPKWTTPVEVPICLSNSLREVVFDGYNGINVECEMIGYMLKHGRALEVMKISCYSSKDVNFELVQEICKFPRNSPACKVEILKTRLRKPWDGGICSYSSD